MNLDLIREIEKAVKELQTIDVQLKRKRQQIEVKKEEIRKAAADEELQKANTEEQQKAADEEIRKAAADEERKLLYSRQDNQKMTDLTRQQLIHEAQYIELSCPFYLELCDNIASKLAKNKKFQLELSSMCDESGDLLSICGYGRNRKGDSFTMRERPFVVFDEMPMEEQANIFKKWCDGKDVIPILCNWLSSISQNGKGGRCRR